MPRPRAGWLTRWLGAALIPLAVVDVASASGWGGITPGETMQRDVEARYGRPTRERRVTEGGLTGSEWAYFEGRAPQGLDRMVVAFGLLRRGRFVPDVVRSLTLYPKPQIFSVVAITEGWGKPDIIGTEDRTGRPVFRYDAKAIMIVLDRTGEWAEVMVFAPEPSGPKP